jgi:hypothetical protein
MIPPPRGRTAVVSGSLREPTRRASTLNPTPTMPVIIPQESGRAATVDRPTSTYLPAAYTEAWRVLGWLGLAFLVMSMIDIVLGWYPVRFGTPEWEFGTISATVAALSIPTLGLYLMLCSAISRERAGVAKAVGIAMIVMAVFLLGMAILYLTTVPLALKSVRTNDMASAALKKAVLKWLILFIGYEALYIAGGLKGLRRRTTS